MSRSEFRFNKKRKHYAYLFKDLGTKRKNILISSKPIMIRKKNKKKQRIQNNVPLYHHPNPKKEGNYFLIPFYYVDEIDSFDIYVYKNWQFHKNDKRKVKRIKKGKN